MKRLTVIIAAASLLTAVLLTGCSKSGGGREGNFVKLGYGGNLCEVPMHIAYEKGFFKEEGLDVELIKLAPGTTFDAVTSGQIDAGFALLASMIQPLANGLPAKITTGLHTGCDIVLVRPNSGFAKAQDLKGKKVGVPSMTSSPVIFAKRVLADNGLNIRMENAEVEFTVYSQADLPLVLSNGTVDAIALNEPAATIAVNEYGFQILFDSAIDKPYCDQYCCVALVSDRLLKRDKRLAAKYTRAMQRGSAYVQGNQEEIARIVNEKKYVAGDPAVNAGVLKKFNYIPSVNGAYDAFGITAPQLQAIGMLSADVNTEALQKNSFVFLDGLNDKYK
jgi:NitT/TauT family transport system substrate-binding protein